MFKSSESYPKFLLASPEAVSDFKKKSIHWLFIRRIRNIAFHPLDENIYLRKSASDAAFNKKFQIISRIQASEFTPHLRVRSETSSIFLKLIATEISGLLSICSFNKTRTVLHRLQAHCSSNSAKCITIYLGTPPPKIPQKKKSLIQNFLKIPV